MGYRKVMGNSPGSPVSTNIATVPPNYGKSKKKNETRILVFDGKEVKELLLPGTYLEVHLRKRNLMFGNMVKYVQVVETHKQLRPNGLVLKSTLDTRVRIRVTGPHNKWALCYFDE